MFNGLLKVPMQFFILLVGVMVFVFYQFNSAPINFNPKANEAVLNSEFAAEYKSLENQYRKLENDKKALILNGVQESDKEQIKALEKESLALKAQAPTVITKAHDSVDTHDQDYVFIHFILNNLPRGLIGLLLAVILSAAMSSTASELNALASTTAIDLYKRNVKGEKSEEHYVKMSKWFTLGWGILAILVACVANLFDNLIQLVNIIGSIFYGNVLGIFLLAFFLKFVKGNAVFIAALITQVIIIGVILMDWLPYLWLNLLGCVLVMTIAVILQSIYTNKN